MIATTSTLQMQQTKSRSEGGLALSGRMVNMDKVVERWFRVKPGEHAPEKWYEVYDEEDPKHRLLVYHGESKHDAIAEAKAYAKEIGVPLEYIKAYELTKMKERG